jgi:hypothetical protein
MVASAGSYALSGSSVVFAKGYYLTVTAGAYALAGASAGLTAARLLSAGAGSYAVNGAAASFAKGFYLTASPGSYGLSGATAAVLRNYVLTITVGVYTVNGTAATLTIAGGGSSARTPPERIAIVRRTSRIAAIEAGVSRTAIVTRPRRVQ